MIKLNRPHCPDPESLSKKNYKEPANKLALKWASHDKCMYCESKVSHIDHAHLEHIKPKADAKYPELKFTWENLGYSCAICNGHKGDKYDESTPYIDPYNENPEEYFIFSGWFIYSKQGLERGDLTISDIKLNRVELLEKRKDKVEKIQSAISACTRTTNISLKEAAIKSLVQESSPDKEFSLAIKHFLKAHAIIT